MDLPSYQNLLNLFKEFLTTAGLSPVSIKNYLSDLRHFFAYLNLSLGTYKSIEVFQSISKYAKKYQEHQQSQFTPLATIKRRLGSLKRFTEYLEQEQNLIIKPSITPEVSPNTSFSPSTQVDHQKVVDLYRNYLVSSKKSQSTIKNYLSDVNHFITWSANNPLTPSLELQNIVSKSNHDSYISYLKLNNHKSSLVTRRQVALRQFAEYLFVHHYISKNELKISFKSPIFLKLGILARPTATLSQIFSNRLGGKFVGVKHIYQKYHNLSFAPYLNLSILLILSTILTIFGYNQIVSDARISSAYPTSLTRPVRQLSFQGRLTDSGSTPITTTANVNFKLYDASTSGTLLYDSGTCAVTPDQDGIFNTFIGGGSCGVEIGSGVFADNPNVFLEVIVGAETLTPRQQIATVGYAINSETLQGYPASPSATANTIPVMDNTGTILLGQVSPVIRSDSGNFGIQGQTISLQTLSGSSGSIVLQPDAGGSVQALVSGTAGNSLRVENANQTNGSLISGYIGNNSDIPALLNLSSGSTETERFSIRADGQTRLSTRNTLTDTAFILNQTGTGDLISASASGTTKFTLTDNGDLAFSGALMPGSNPGTSGYILSSTGTGTTPTWIDPSSLAGSSVWSDLTAPTANLSLNHSTYTTAFDWATGTSTNDLFTLTTAASSNGTGSLLNLQTGAASTVNPLRVRAGATESLFVNNSGNVGIGTTAPGTKAEIIGGYLTIADGESSGAGRAYFGKGATYGYGGTTPMYIRGSAGLWYLTGLGGEELTIDLNAGGASTMTFSQGNAVLNANAASAGLLLQTQGTTKMTVLSGGNVGIGTTAPGTRLQVKSSADNGQTVFVERFSGTTAVVDMGQFTGGYGFMRTYNNLAVADNLIRSGGSSYFNGGNVGVGDTTPSSLFTVGNGDLFQINTTGQIGSQQAPVSDYLFSLAGTTGNDNSRIIDITQANDVSEDTSVINIANTANVGTITGTTRNIKNQYLSLTPTVSVDNVTTPSVANIIGTDQALDLSNTTLADTPNNYAQLTTYGNKTSITGTPVINNTDASGDQARHTVYGAHNSITLTPTLTAANDVYGAYYGTYNNVAITSSGNAGYTSYIYGNYNGVSGNLTTTGGTSHVGEYISTTGTANNNYGLHIAQVAQATNNYGIRLDGVDASSTNYALYSGAAAQSYFAGFLGLGNTSPQAALDVTGDIYLSSGISTFATAVSDGTVEATKFCTGDGETNCVTDFAALSGGATIWTDGGTYIYPTTGEVLGNSTTAGANKIAGLYLADSAPITLGTDNDVTFSFAGTTLAVTQGNNDINFDSDTLFIDGSANMIGIGVSAPVAKLHVNTGVNQNFRVEAGNAAGSPATGVAIRSLNDANSSLLPLTLQGSVILFNNGNVGIGTTAPSSQLHVNGAGQTTADLTDAGNTGGTINIQSSDSSVNSGGALVFGAGADKFAAIKSLYTDGTANGVGDLAISLRTTTADTNLSEKMRITKAGYVGIGDTSPAHMFVVGNGDLFQVTSAGHAKAPTLALGAATVAPSNRLLDITSTGAITGAANYSIYNSRTVTGTLSQDSAWPYTVNFYNNLGISASDGAYNHIVTNQYNNTVLSDGYTVDTMRGVTSYNIINSNTLSTFGNTATVSASVYGVSQLASSGIVTSQYGGQFSSHVSNAGGTIGGSRAVNGDSFTSVDGAVMTSGIGAAGGVYEGVTHTTGGIATGYGGYFTAEDATTTYGVYARGLQNTAGTETFASMYGLYGECQTNSAGSTVTNCFGVRGNVTETSGTISNGYAGYFSSTTALATAYGVYSNVTGASSANYGVYTNVSGATTNYSIYANGSANSFFGGAIGVGVTTPNTSALLDLTSTTKGFLPPRMTEVQRDAIVSPATGLMVFNTTTSQYNVFNGSIWNGVGGSGKWSDLTAPTANLSLNHSTYTTAFDWATGTSTNDLFTLTTAASSNGTGSLLNLQTGAASTVNPLRVRAGATESLFVNNSGNVGIGNIVPQVKLDVTGDASVSGNLTMGYNSAIRPAYSTLNFDYKSGANAWTRAMLVDNNGNLIPGANDTFYLGKGADAWKGIFINQAIFDGSGTASITLNTVPKRLENGAWDVTGGHLTVSGGNLYTDQDLYIGDASSDAVTVNSATWTFANDTNFVLSGGVNGLSLDSTTFSVDATNDRIGIGTAAPNTKLEVNGDIRSTRSGTATQYIDISGGDANAMFITGTPTSTAEKPLRITNAGVASSTNTRIDFYIETTRRAYFDNLGDFIPGANNTYYLGKGGSAGSWKGLYLGQSIYDAAGTATITINTSPKRLDNGAWEVSSGNFTVSSGNLSVSGTSSLTGDLTIGGGTGKINVGTIDPPYTINGDKYATYFAGMIGVKEETTGKIATSHFNGLGYSTVIDFKNQPQGSDLWLFSKATNLRDQINRMTVLLSPEGQARAWYELDYEERILTIFTSTPTSVSYRLSAPRFDSDRWTNYRHNDIVGFVLDDPDFVSTINYPTAANITITPASAGHYIISNNGSDIVEVGNFYTAMIANLTTGISRAQEIISDTLSLNTKLITPLAEIDTLNTNKLTSAEATITGTLTASIIRSSTTDLLNDQYAILNDKYATASAILDLLVAQSTNSAGIATTPVATASPEIIANLDLEHLSANTIAVNTIDTTDTTLFIGSVSKTINLLASTMIISPDGQISINGDLSVSGSLIAKNIEAESVSLSTTGFGPLLELSTDNELVASIDSSGSAAFKTVATDSLIIASGQTITNPDTAEVTSNASIGTATILTGQTELVIQNAQVLDSSFIYLTPVSNTNNAVLYLKSKTAGSSFTVGLTSPATSDISFNYWIVQTQ